MLEELYEITDDNKTNILIVDDREENIIALEALLENPILNVHKALSGNEALKLLLTYEYALILLDVQMPEMNGYEVADLMRGNEKTRHVPIIFVTAINKEEKYIYFGYKTGAVDYLFKPINQYILKNKVSVFLELFFQKKLLQKKNEELEKLNHKLSEMFFLDGLTGIANRRRFNEYLKHEWERCKRLKSELTIIMLDIDYFKQYNDTYGHVKGDECLIKIASVLETSSRRSIDLIARYGGEEFAVILPNSTIEEGAKLAEIIQTSIKTLNIEHIASKVSSNLTISFGIASTVPTNDITYESVITSADNALYEAKESGRNRIACYN